MSRAKDRGGKRLRLAERILDARDILATDVGVRVHAVVLGNVHVSDGSQTSFSIGAVFRHRSALKVLPLREQGDRTIVWDKSDLAKSLSALLKLAYCNLPLDAFRLKMYARSTTFTKIEQPYPYHLKQYSFDPRAV